MRYPHLSEKWAFRWKCHIKNSIGGESRLKYLVQLTEEGKVFLTNLKFTNASWLRPNESTWSSLEEYIPSNDFFSLESESSGHLWLFTGSFYNQNVNVDNGQFPSFMTDDEKEATRNLLNTFDLEELIDEFDKRKK